MPASIPQHKHKVLFLCTGNSCRSPMAEGLTNGLMGDTWEAYSAGTDPAGFVQPMVTRALREIGIDPQVTSKSVDQFRDTPFDLVITLCDDADQNCPAWLGQGRRLHIGFSDPSDVEGSDAERLAAFRRTRDDMRVRILPLLIDIIPAKET